MIEAGRRRERQRVSLTQRAPAIGAREELVRQTQAQTAGFGGIGQVGQARDAAPRRFVFTQCQRVGVVETERHRHLELARCQQRIELIQRRVVLPLQHLARNRAGVFGVDIDCTRAQRLFENAGVAQTLLVGGGDAVCLQRLAHDLAEDVGLGEALGANRNGRGRKCGRGSSCDSGADSHKQCSRGVTRQGTGKGKGQRAAQPVWAVNQHGMQNSTGVSTGIAPPWRMPCPHKSNPCASSGQRSCKPLPPRVSGATFRRNPIKTLRPAPLPQLYAALKSASPFCSATRSSHEQSLRFQSRHDRQGHHV